jgi:hypothetical protein
VPANLNDTRPSLDGYRFQVIERLKSARDILSEVGVMLNGTGLSRGAQKNLLGALATSLLSRFEVMNSLVRTIARITSPGLSRSGAGA